MAFSIDSTTYRSPNHDARPVGTDIWALILHSCEGKPAGDEQQSSIPWLCNPSSGVSAHYYVTRAGVIYQLVSDVRRAWHAGVSVLNGVWFCNNYSLGVELEHRDNAAPYPQIQMNALSWLCQQKIAEHGILRTGIATHRKVASDAGRDDRFDPTDWSDLAFTTWIHSLYATNPLQARMLPGPPGTVPIFCSAAAAEFYAQRGGLAQCGYPLRDEYPTHGQNGQPCTVLRCERVIIKTSAGYGVEQALLSEARNEGWLP